MTAETNIEFPFECYRVDAEETEEIKKYFSQLFTQLIRLGSKRYFFNKEIEDTVLDIYNMELRPTDTFVLSFPRSGTTWTQELVWLLRNNCDFETAIGTPLPIRFPFLESGALLNSNVRDELSKSSLFEKIVAENVLLDVKSLSTVQSPRFMKCHLPFSLLPPSLLDTAKVVYVARDPRDVAVSNFFHMQSINMVPMDRDFKRYWNFFIESKILCCPYFEHVKEAWNQRNHPNMTFIFYEELSKDLPAVARRLATFLGKEYSEEQFQALCDYLKFDNFKNNASVNLKELQDSGVMSGSFIRKGKPGGWREHFDAEMTQQAESWMADNLRDTDLRFPNVE